MELKVANSDGTLLSAGSVCVRLLVRVCVRLGLFEYPCLRMGFCGNDTNLE